MVEKKVGQEYDEEVVYHSIPFLMNLRDRKENQRANIFDRHIYFKENATLLEIGTGDGIFSSFLKKKYWYTVWWYDIQNLLSKNACLDAYYVWWYEILESVLAIKSFDGIVIAYTLHHMSDQQIFSLFTILEKYNRPLIILEETYTRTKTIVCLNDLISNLFQYGIAKINIKEYFQLNFKKSKTRMHYFEKHWFIVSILWKKLRYFYLPTVAFLLKKK